MYLYEWLAFDGREKVDYQKLVEETEKQKIKGGKIPPLSVRHSVSSSVFDNESLYEHNPTYIDVRTPNDEKRGALTLTIGSAGILLMSMFIVIAMNLLEAVLETNTSLFPWDDYMFSFVTLPISGTSLYLYFKHAFRHLRLEAFTARRLIVRFNRITRRVYLLRPKHLGGVVALDWDKAEVCLDLNMSEAQGIGGFVLLGWEKESLGVFDVEGQPKDDFEITFVGKPTRDASELLAFWEYIRRYMEYGPDAAPRPKRLISKFPWPWNSFKAAWRLDTGFLGKPVLWSFILINLLLLPVILIHGVFHWISLLLCYEPKFPKTIEQAGELRDGTN